MSRDEFIKKLIIGSANFTQRYGMDSTKVNPNEIKKILNFAKKNRIKEVDTANTYYAHENYLKEKNIFKKIDKKFQFIAKVKPDQRWTSLDYCQKRINEYFAIFMGNRVQTLLIHDISILLKAEGPKIFENLKILKKKKYFRNIGFSIYDIKCLDYLMLNYDIDVVQCPYNILDKRIISSGWFKKLKDKGIEIHIRSIFLQGLLVNELVYKKKYFKKWKKSFFEWFKILKKNNVSPIDYCVNDLLNYNFDKIIIGINNCDNLKDIVNFKLIKKKDLKLDIKSNDLKLIDPRNWK